MRGKEGTAAFLNQGLREGKETGREREIGVEREFTHACAAHIFSNEMQAREFTKLVKEFGDGRISLWRRVDNNSQRLFVEDVHKTHDLLLASSVADVSMLEEPIVGTAFVASASASDSVFLQIVTEVPGVARDDQRDCRLILPIMMTIVYIYY